MRKSQKIYEEKRRSAKSNHKRSMIGIFDSGCGGLSVLRELVRAIPQYDYLYLGDNARVPYGTRSEKEIFEFTKQGVDILFRRGASIAILACNTASAGALRRIQQEFLPKRYPKHRVLGIIIPTAEEVAKLTISGAVGVLATEATVHSYTYDRELAKLNARIKVYQEACPRLVPMIEMGVTDGEGFHRVIRAHTRNLLYRRKKIDTVILGCTHYELVKDAIALHMPDSIRLVAQSSIVAQKLKGYLVRHPEIEQQLTCRGTRTFLSTERSPRIDRLGSLFYGKPIQFERVRFSGEASSG